MVDFSKKNWPRVFGVKYLPWGYNKGIQDILSYIELLATSISVTSGQINKTRNRMTFKTSLDGLANGVTIGVIILFASIIGGQLIPSYGTDPVGSAFLSGLLIGICLLCFLFRPMNYVLTNEKLIVHRLISDITIKRKDILTVREVSKTDMGLTIRTFGVGGLFGYFGRFSNSKIGSLTMYATRRNKTVLIDTGNRKIILTPDNPVELVKQLLIG